MNPQMNAEANAPGLERDVPLSGTERRILSAVQNSSGRRLRIAPADMTVASHILVAGSQIWYIGDGLPDERCIYMAQTDLEGASRCFIQSLGRKKVLSRLLDGRILTQDPSYPRGDVLRLSDRIERQLEREHRRACVRPA
jgi:hypothetical protein